MSLRACWKVLTVEDNPIYLNFLLKLEFGDIDQYLVTREEVFGE